MVGESVALNCRTLHIKASYRTRETGRKMALNVEKVCVIIKSIILAKPVLHEVSRVLLRFASSISIMLGTPERLTRPANKAVIGGDSVLKGLRCTGTFRLFVCLSVDFIFYSLLFF